MSTILGTDGNDKIDVPSTGDQLVAAGAGADTITVASSSRDARVVTVDGGTGDDVISVEAYGAQVVTVHGGAGADTFKIVSGGRYYGDAGADTFSIEGPGGGGLPFTIADFSSDDKIDLVPFLKSSTAWFENNDPFDPVFGDLRLVQLGADTVIQGDWKFGSWISLGVLSNVQASTLTAAQLGFKPSVADLQFYKVTPLTQTFAEGARAEFTITLPKAAAGYVNINFSMTPDSTGSGGSSQEAHFSPGETTKIISFLIPEDSKLNGYFFFSGTSSADFMADPRTPPAFSYIDNEASGFSVYISSIQQAYQTFTLGAPPPPNQNPWLDISYYRPEDTTRSVIVQLEKLVLGATSVALTAYQFFTGKTPSAAGLAYLVNSPDNTSDLNDKFGIYNGMNTENRYINFAANLGLIGEGKAGFAAAYGGLDFRQAVEKAYDAVIGKAYAQAAGINVQAAIDGVVASKAYFDALASERMGGFDHDLAMKAGVVGYLIVEGLKADVGLYARGVENFYLDFTDGVAQHNVDLVGVYGPGTYLDRM